jgi:outer membrane protein assembly factor BamD (BamD/ComL family)
MTDFRPIRRAALALLAAAALTGCAVFRTPPPLTVESAYTAGMQAFQDGRHRRAAELLSQFVAAAGADARLKGALMALGRSHLETRDYVTAAADFLRVATEFPSDPEAATARFGLCEAYHSLAPRTRWRPARSWTPSTPRPPSPTARATPPSTPAPRRRSRRCSG